MTATKTKLGKDITVGDKVTKEDGTVARVTGISNGIYRNHVMLDLSTGGWAQVPRDAEVELAK